MDASQVQDLQASWKAIAPDPSLRKVEQLKTIDALGKAIFTELLKRHPEMYTFWSFPKVDGEIDFSSAKFKMHGRLVIGKLGQWIEELVDVAAAVSNITLLIEKHKEYGLEEKHYGRLAAVILNVLDDVADTKDGWPPRQREAWVTLFGVLSGLAKEAHASDACNGAVKAAPETAGNAAMSTTAEL